MAEGHREASKSIACSPIQPLRSDDILVRSVPFVVGARTSIVVAMDWTDFDRHESY